MNRNQVGNGAWWLELFLARTFFEACDWHPNVENHQQNRRGRLNHFCIDCETAACYHCMREEHVNHREITVYKLSHQDVVAQEQMKGHIDCSRIQAYASNGRKVLAIHPLDHEKSGEKNPDRACWTCRRVLMNPDIYHYCSIACKPSNNPNADTTSERSGFRKRRRKMLKPQRAPFF